MASLTALRGDETGDTRQLDAPETVVGRDEDCGIRIDGLGLSRRHCTIVRQGDRFYIRDLSSENGTWVNGERIAERELRDGDQVGLGLQATFRFHNDFQAPAVEPSGPTSAPAATTVPLAVKSAGDERVASRWLVVVVLVATFVLIAILAHFSLKG